MSKHNKKFIAVILLIVITALVMVFWPDTTSDESVEPRKPLSIQTWTTSNQAKVLYVYAPELPMVDIQLVFDAGSVRDKDKPGVANFTNGLLNHGAVENNKTLTVDDIAERFDNIGAEYSADVSRDYAEVSLRTLTEPGLLQSAVKTLNAVISDPDFNNDELERVRKQLLLGFSAREQSPGTIADEIFYQSLYKEHPYAKPVVGMKESVAALTRDDLVSFYKTHYVGVNAVVTIVGDVTKDKARQLAEDIIGRLPKGEKSVSLTEVGDSESSAHHHEHPSSQTHIIVGQPGIKRKDKDYFKLYLGNHILGGSGFGSRIVKEIREKRGLAYSSYSYFYPMQERGPFIMGMQTSNKQTDEALQVLMQTLAEFIEQGPTAEELEHAKKNITGGFPLRIDSNRDISNYLAVIGFYNLPLDYLQAFNQRIESISAADIQDAFKRRIDPENMITVTVGTKVAK